MAQITVDLFLVNFPEFAVDRSLYPNSKIQFWLDLAYRRLTAARWANLLDTGAQLYTAHNIVLEAQALKAAQSGGIPGISTGPINSKSVDKVSVGYDTSAASMENAGDYNLTTYGIRYWKLVQIVGSGAVQIGVGCGPATVPVFPTW
jgi:hypothetical protein